MSVAWRCDVTGNPVGTDTQMIGHPCKCQGCRAVAEIERLEEIIADRFEVKFRLAEKVARQHAALEAVDALWGQDALNFCEEMGWGSPVGIVWKQVREALGVSLTHGQREQP